MTEIYVTIAVLSVVGGALAWLAERAFRGLFGKESPWRWGWLSRPLPPTRDKRKLNKLITILDVAGLTIAAGMLAWHFGVFALPDPLLWYFVVPLAVICVIGRAKAVTRYLRRDAQI